MSELRVTSAKKREQDQLAVLLQDYLAEFDEFENVEKNDDGTYAYPFLPHYWEDPNRYPFLFRTDDAHAGFALLRFEVDPASGRESMEMAEFYIAPPYRRHGYGRQAARRLWDLFPGRWVVRVLKSNTRAYPFWKTIIDEYTGGRFDEQPPSGPIGGMYTFTFESATSAEIPDDVEPDLLDF